MNPEGFGRLREILLEALALPEEERAAHLDRACAGDAELRAEAESLLAREASVAAEVRTGAAASLLPTTNAAPASQPRAMPERVGPYRILGILGEGGMGVVYEAEQQQPRRRVAVKVVRGGRHVDAAAVRMFQREAETLARLRHPNIGAIYESGCTDDGQHFFAMELVIGEPLGEFLKRRPPATATPELRFRLALFRKVAEAVHYAHQRGVIHRDLKPSNIVVTEEAVRDAPASLAGARLPEVKVLDFGLARITEGDVAAATVTTEVGLIRGTLAYMSPEQARGDPGEIDLRTDVYALGVILYEMLAGRRPYDVASRSLPEAVRVICEDPPAPLRRAWGKARRPDADLETILGKALEKAFDRRYASAAALAEDVERYLASQPILARPPSGAYQLRKFAARHRALVGGVLATFAVLVAGATTSTILGLREARQRRTAEEIAAFQAAMLREVDPEAMGRRLLGDLRARVAETRRRRDASAEEIEAALASLDAALQGVNGTSLALRMIDEDVLDRAVRSVGEDFADEPLVASRLLDSIARTYQRLGLPDRAEPLLRAVLETRERLLGRDNPERLSAINNLGNLLVGLGRADEAEPYWREYLDRVRNRGGDDDPATVNAINNLGGLAEQRGDLAGAERHFGDALERSRRALGADASLTLMVVNNLAHALRQQGRLAEAEERYREALEGQRRSGDTGSIPKTMVNLAGVLGAQGKLDEAEQHLRDAVDGRRRMLGDDHPDTLGVISNLAVLLEERGRLEEAERLGREALEGCRRVLGNDHPETLTSLHNRGVLLTRLGRLEEAELLCREAVDGRRRVLGDDHPVTLASIDALGGLLQLRGRLDEAEPLCREALTGRRRLLGDDHPDTLASMGRVGSLLVRKGRLTEAEPFHRDALERRRRTLGDDHPATLSSMVDMGHLRQLQGDLAEAERFNRQALERRRRVLGDDHPDTLASMSGVGQVLLQRGRPDDAEPYLREALERRRRVLGEDHPATLNSFHAMGTLLEARGELEEAERHYRKAFEGRRRAFGDGHPVTVSSREKLAAVRRRLGREPGNP